MKAVTESWARLVGSAVLANTVYQSASRTPDIQHLVPLRTQPPASSGSGVARVRMPMTSLPGLGLRQAEGGALPSPWRCRAGSAASAPRSRRSSPGPVGSRVSSSMSAAVLEYLATSSMAMVSPRMPAPEPPYSSGMHSPSSPASRKASKTSVGYSPRACRSPGPGA